MQFGEVNRYAYKVFDDGAIPRMIIVMPDAGSSWYVNSYDGEEKYDDFFIKEFMPAIEKISIQRTKKVQGCGWFLNAWIRVHDLLTKVS